MDQVKLINRSENITNQKPTFFELLKCPICLDLVFDPVIEL
jgi:hypothetical protein